MARRGRDEPADLAERDDPAADLVAVAREIVLRSLTVRARSRAELVATLRKRGVPDAAASEVLERFAELRLVDDSAFAEQWVEGARRRQRSRAVLRQELRAKGLDPETVQEAVASVSDDDEFASALALARKRAAATAGLDAGVRYRRVAGALARRGFGPEVTRRAVREALADIDGGADADLLP